MTVRSDEINAYIKATAGDEFSAKDFRTWHATVLAAVALARARPPASRAARERAIVRAVAEAAGGSATPRPSCRASYIDPRVIERYRPARRSRPRSRASVAATARRRRPACGWSVR